MPEPHEIGSAPLPRGPHDEPRRTPAQPSDLVDVAHLVTAYYTGVPDPEDVDQQVAFGTSGHRGTSAEDVVQRDPHPRDHAGDLRLPPRAGVRRPAVHRPRHPRALRAGVGDRARGARRQRRDRARRRPRRLHADAGGLARDHPRQPRQGPPGRAWPTASWSRPSHNPPSDGGFKYNPPHGGPADTDATSVIAARANELIKGGLADVRRIAVRPGPGRPRRRTTSSGPTSTTCPHVARPRRDPRGRRADRRRPARAARASPTGARSASGTGST